MTTRLDRLVLLLDTGSTAAVRRTAAQQLGEIQKQHPGELYNLLSRVVVHLRSKAWDTRWAAGLALEAIAANVPSWDPSTTTQNNDTTASLEDTHKLNFNQFDLASVLSHGKLLLGSAGKEYDIDFSDMTPQERLEMQRRNLKDRLGLGSQFMDVELVDDIDLDARKSSNRKKQVSPKPTPTTSTQQPPPSSTPAVQEINMAGLSARERNMLKRKMKNDAKMNKNKEKVRVLDLKGKSTAKAIKTEPEASDKDFALTPQPQSDKFVVESKAPIAPQESRPDQPQSEWPFKIICEHLCMDLFDPTWEIRHGAGIGLRSILKAHGEEGVDKAKQEELHNAWLEDVAIRLLCVFSLDRFADFVSDQVVCPVRETCSQTLGVVLQYMQPEAVTKVHATLLKLISQEDSAFGGKSIWEVRHAGLLGLKYTVAVRKDLAEILVEGTTGAVILGLRDHDDDVRAVSATTLLPITAEFVRMSSEERIHDVITTLWDCLVDLKDDLTASTAAVMDLIAKMFEQPGVMDIVRSGCSLADLVPRLYPFFRHTITGVRLAVLNTLLTFLTCRTAAEWVDERVYRLVFQNLVVEEKPEILKTTLNVWRHLTMEGYVDSQYVLQGTQNWLGSWFEVTMTPIGQPIDIATHFYKPPGAFGFGGATSIDASARKERTSKMDVDVGIGTSKNEDATHNLDVGMISQDFSLITTEQVLRCRIACAEALGIAMSSWPDDSMELSYQEVLLTLLSSQWALKRQLGAMVIEEWAKAVLKSRYNADCISHAPVNAILALSHKFPQTLSQAMIANLENAAIQTTNFYFELVYLLKRIRGECQALLNGFAEAKVPATMIPALPSFVLGEALPEQENLFTIESASWVVGESYDALVARLPRGKGKAVALKTLEDRQRRVVSSIGYYEELKQKVEINVYAATAGAVVELGVLPAKLNPIIHSVMNSVKFEENCDLQQRSASTLADLVALCARSTGRLNPNDKIVKNLCKFLCSDTSKTPLLEDSPVKSAILSIQKEDTGKSAANTSKEAPIITPEQKEAQLMKRGAETSLHVLCDRFGSKVFDIVPMMWECMSLKLRNVFGKAGRTDDADEADALISSDYSIGQEVIDALTVVTTVVPYISSELWGQVAEIVPDICNALRSSFAVIRHLSARCLATIANVITAETMQIVIERVLPELGNTVNVYNRQGAAELVYHLVQLLDTKVLPYTIFLIVPILGRMSDVDDSVRLICTNCFALLIKLVPLEAGIPDPPGMSKEMLAHRNEERRFLSQLLDSSKVENFEIPVKIKAELRKYQQEGVSWLAFLNKFHLHGILCDDMGLGKTLQSICILASDHYLRAERYKASKAPDSIPCPSLVICPPTLTGHWYHEVRNYAENLKPMLYTGGPGERKRLRSVFGKHDVIIMSYDIIRNDIDDLAGVQWNYCILDEGHIIKNGRTKITRAIKSVKSNHRLILSGTPIQNNVLELWSLFDFLMPGFLGSEKMFNERFGKPILASRDAKSSSKDQEAGALALEALHKQVLPFLLRRLKEDVLHDLPPKIIQDYYCELSDLQKNLYEEFAKSQAKNAVEQDLESDDTKSNGSGRSATHIFQALQYLRKLCNHPLLVVNEKHPSYDKVQQMLTRTGTSLHDINNAPKLMGLKQLLGECGIGVTNTEPESDPASITTVGAVSQHRALIFCQLKTMLDIIETDLFKKLMPTVSYLRLDGSVDASRRHELVQKFNADPSIDVLLLTTHVGGLGLNLTGADTVIFVEHDWNPMKDLQAMDRAHRIGQKKVVNVYRLITRGTLEEKIMGLQKFKLNIANTVVNQQNSGLQSMDTDQILDLFNVSGADETEAKQKKASKAKSVEAEGTGKAKHVLENLENLWEEKDYEEEYNIDSFISSLK
ncbi:TATA-binding protein-associated factor mot1 [Apophysomyces ossiformis]|uniref:TATA-binding protein-associated factor mot1 n=1 Tax=Apophysomyces ossiformis TaxID=679940 RepID=A0A8H7BQI6_9FUNG|nr:TATA-binding protein-associated factor mot1 [Apophysomyces ossiformis]